MNCSVIGVITIASTFVPVASEFAVFDLGGARFACRVFSTGQPTIFARAKAGHKACQGCHGLGFFLAEVSGEPLVTDIMLKSRQGFGVRTVDYLVLFS